jgi:superfamily II DNA or RNA helicase
MLSDVLTQWSPKLLIARPYQTECLQRFIERIDHCERGGLIVLGTGLGKSKIMGDIAQWWLANRSGGVGIASHRRELVKQNADEFDNHIGKPGTCKIDLGSEHRMREEDWDQVRRGGVVSFTVQTLQGRRLSKAGAGSLGLILNDETHRVRDKGQYVKTRDYFGCKWVGLTATPDRTDGQGLVPNMYDECWYGNLCKDDSGQRAPHCFCGEGQMLNDFVEQGWLVPPKIQHVHVSKLKWEWLKGRSGKDFTNDQVAKVWSDYEAIHEFVAPIVKEVGAKKTLYFCPGVEQAKGVADVINSSSSPRRIAEYVASYRIEEDNSQRNFDPAERRSIVRRFGDLNDELQHVSNMGVFVEGTNIPIISAIGWLRFTKSRVLLAQGAGRAFRSWPGVLSGLEHATAAERRAAIAASPKPHALIFDPTRRAGTKLRLAHVVDIFSQGVGVDVQRQIDAIIKRKAKSGEEYDPRQVIEEAKYLESPYFKGLRAALLEIAPTVDYRLVEVDPYKGDDSDWSRPKPKPKVRTIGDATPAQKDKVRYLSSTKYSDDFYQSLTKKQAGAMIGKLMSSPVVGWVANKLRAAGKVVPATNAEGMAMLKTIPRS